MFRILAVGLILATATPALAANVPEPYRREVIQYRCPDIPYPTARYIEENYFKIGLWQRSLIRIAYFAGVAGDRTRLTIYCEELRKAGRKIN